MVTLLFRTYEGLLGQILSVAFDVVPLYGNAGERQRHSRLSYRCCPRLAAAKLDAIRSISATLSKENSRGRM
jgi:hypothetical protein